MKIVVAPGGQVGTGIDCKGHREFSRVMEVFCILTGIWSTQADVFTDFVKWYTASKICAFH